MPTHYIVSYERIAVRPGATDAATADDGAWIWFDHPVTVTLRHRDSAACVLEAQAERAVVAYGPHRCRRIILWAWGEQMDVDWDTCLASLNAKDPRWRHRAPLADN